MYFIHNRVEDIGSVEERLQALVPEANIRIGHGQMPERELEQVMLDFYHRRFNVLLCTTIVESGIDVPTANTIIVNRADRFGLAQLHQLRGARRAIASQGIRLPDCSAPHGDDGRCRQAPGRHRFAGRSRFRIYAGDTRSRDSRRRRVARRYAKRDKSRRSVSLCIRNCWGAPSTR